MSSSSDDDVPIAQKKYAAHVTVAEPINGGGDGDSSSEDDKPIRETLKSAKRTAAKVGMTPKSKGKAVKMEAASSGKKKPPSQKKPEKKPQKKAAVAKKVTSGNGASTSKAAGPERVRKVYDLPGQTREAPPDGDPLRRFYTSLLEQCPSSEMARRWCAMYGLLARKDAEAWVAEQARKKAGSPTKAPVRRTAAVVGASSKKRKKEESEAEEGSDGEDDFKSSTKRARKEAPRKKAAAGKKATKQEKKGKRPAVAASSGGSESEEADASADEEVMPAKKQRATLSKAVPKAPASRKPKAQRDVAFVDGGMEGSDSEDDLPLLQRKNAAA